MPSRQDRIRRLFAASQDRLCSTVVLGAVDVSVMLFVIAAAEAIEKEIKPSSEPYEADNVCPEWALEMLREALAQLNEVHP